MTYQAGRGRSPHSAWLVRVLPVVLGVGFLACGESPTKPSDPTDPRQAPEIVTIDGKGLTLKADLWRDFMPISPPDGQPLIVVFTVTTVGQSPFPAGVTADRGWVLNGADTWETPLVSERQPSPGSASLEVVARDGPKWGPFIEVDVVVRLRDSTGNKHLLQAKRQIIQATY